MRNYKNILMIFLVVIFTNKFFAQANFDKQQKRLPKTNVELDKVYAKFNINNISTWVKNDGEADVSPFGNSGFVFPKGGGKTAVFQSGLIWGAKVNGEIRVGGSTYNQGLLPGKVLEDGTRENDSLYITRIYRVRRDYKTGDLTSESVDENKSKEEIYNKYKLDWNEWPAERGAPFDDKNKNGSYEPEVDIPGVKGADQTIWFVANDFDNIVAGIPFGSPPLKIEMQTTVWGYNSIPFLQNVLFKEYKIINKNEDPFKEMYFSIWSDIDIGGAVDDYSGCDTLLNLGYSYNANDNDDVYNYTPPAVGFQLLKGPYGRNEYLSMSSFVYYLSYYNLGEYDDRALEYYNYMKGIIGYSGKPFINPLTDLPSKFVVSGDPLTNTGWVDGISLPASDRRNMVNSGPFEMAPGDTQTVVFAEIAAMGTDRLNSVFLLKKNADAVNLFYDKLFSSINGKVEPKLTAKPFDKKILLNWGEFKDEINNIENHGPGLLNFEGYNIYQLPEKNSLAKDYKKIKTFDKVNGIKIFTSGNSFTEYGNDNFPFVQTGSDNGIKRFFEIDKNYISNEPLVNGNPYYFVVSYYNVYKDNSEYNFSYEIYSEPIKVIPHNPNPGIRYESEIGDSIYALHARGSAQAEVNIIVVDPTEVTGNEYEIRFRKNNENKIVWDLENITENETVLTNQINISGTDDYVIVDGIRIIITDDVNQKITEEDFYRFTTPKVIYDEELAKVDVEKINVFPNPYYGYNTMETQKLGNFVMINHLPDKAVIRVFNLAGQLVRTLRKENTEQFYLWDLQNEHQLLVASGLYILHIEMPELGKVKVLKLAVILGTEVPDFY